MLPGACDPPVKYYRRSLPGVSGYAFTLSDLSDGLVASIFVRAGAHFTLYDEQRVVVGEYDAPHIFVNAYFSRFQSIGQCPIIQPGTILVGDPNQDTAYLGAYSIVLGETPKATDLDLRTRQSANATAHHTSHHVTLEGISSALWLANSLVVRRGGTATIDATLSSSFDTNCEKIELRLAENYRANRTFEHFDVPEVTQAPSPDAWGLRVVSVEPNSDGSKSVVMELSIPYNAPIGRYYPELVTKDRYSDVVLSTQRFDSTIGEYGDIVILFNAWNPSDQVAFSGGAASKHILRRADAVRLFRPDGTFWTKTWNVVPHQGIVLETALEFLNPLTAVQRADAATVSRHLAMRVNGRNPGGMLYGRWSTAKDLDSNTHCEPVSSRVTITPQETTAIESIPGTRAMIGQFRSNFYQPVSRAQCWIFAGVLCSMSRTLGIPSRIMTGENSTADWGSANLLHFADGYLTDFYKRVGGRVRPDWCRQIDGSWNFHNWVESWMSRTGTSGFNARDWQAIDATPIHATRPSRYVVGLSPPAIGPAPVPAIAAGSFVTPFNLVSMYSVHNALRPQVLLRANGTDNQFQVINPWLVTTFGRGVWTDDRSISAPLSTLPVEVGSRYVSSAPPPPAIIAPPLNWMSFPRAVPMDTACEGHLVLANLSDQDRTYAWSVDVYAFDFNSGIPGEQIISELSGTTVVAAGQTAIVPIVIPAASIASSNVSSFMIFGSAAFGDGDDDFLVGKVQVGISEPHLTIEVSPRETHVTGAATVRVRSVAPLTALLSAAVLRLTATEEKAWLAPNQTEVVVPLGTLQAGATIDLSVMMRSRFPGSDVLRAKLEAPRIHWVEVSEEVLISGCAGDFDESGGVNVGDIFSFLNTYFVESALSCQWGRIADVNGDGCVTVGDLYDFLANYFATCIPE